LVEETWLSFFPPKLRRLLLSAPPEVRGRWQELRLRQGQPVLALVGDGQIWLDQPGPGDNPRLTAEDLEAAFQSMAQYSVYALEEELRRGYLTLPGGHRLGFAGHAVLESGNIRLLRRISSLNLRLAKAVRGPGEIILPSLILAGRFLSTLILSPPRCGKTTLLRDLVRLLSLGQPALRLPGRQISLVDERSEVAGTFQGQAQLDVGPRTDVLDGAPKAEGMMLMLRAMAPDVLAVDEIGRPEDAEAVAEAAKAGVSVLATAHAGSPDEARRRPILGRLLESDYFQRLVVLDDSRGPGTVRGIYQQPRDPGTGAGTCSDSWAPSSFWRGPAASGA